jgi:hypothetical protein
MTPRFSYPAYQIGQLQQAADMQWRAACRHFHERVSLYKICPGRWNLAQMPIAIVKVHEALREDATVFNQIKLLATQGMERMRDPYPADFLARDGCNRRDIERHGRKAAAARAPSAPGR